MNSFKIEKDELGFIKAISLNGYHILHLISGSVRNEKNAQKVVDILNSISKTATVTEVNFKEDSE